jgi:DNA-binding IclR family transcriptional regulator
MKLGSLEKSMQIIEIMAANNRGLALSQLAALSGLPPSSVHHVLSTLRGRNYVMQDPETKKYSLGFRFLSISRSILNGFDIRKISQSYLYSLSQELKESVQLGVWVNNMVLFVDKANVSNCHLAVLIHVGATLPPHVAASGKILMTEKSHKEIKEIFKREGLTSHGPRSITSMPLLLQELETVKRRGYSIDDEESHMGLRAVAVPIKRDGKTLAALSVIGPVFNMPMERITQEILPRIKNTASVLSEKVQW